MPVKNIGTITKTYGFEGSVIVRSDGRITREPEKGEPVFIIIDGIPVPFFTREAFTPSPDTLIISFDDYMTSGAVEYLKGCEVKTGEDTKSENGTDDLTGYRIIDRESGFRGQIVSVIRTPGQILANVSSAGKTVLIPLHPDLIIEADHGKRLIVMSLPAGLIRLNE